MDAAEPNRPTLGVLLINLGTPEAPTPAALRRYLGEFLWDPRVVETPRALWWLILNGVILRVRPRRSAQAYRRIWTPEGSPLLVLSRRLSAAVEAALAEAGQPMPVALGMRYGQPSIAQGLTRLKDAGATEIVVLPLYPQYSASTAASSFDAVARVLRDWREIPSLHFVRDYHDDDAYLDAVADKIRGHWQAHGRGEKLLLSYHGLPKRFAQRGDPYPEQCRISSERIARRLGLEPDRWLMTFQSRFGPQAWLTPYTDKTLETLAREGVRSVDLACPGFAVDCLETLEENAMVNRDLFLAAGGREFRYLPCLNDDAAHAAALTRLALRAAGLQSYWRST